MIEVKGYNLEPLYIVKKCVMGLQCLDQEGIGPRTKVIMGCGGSSEDWVVCESVTDFIKKYDEAV